MSGYFTEIAGQVAGIVSFAAFLPYVLAILRGRTTPSRATWFIWTVVGIILATSYYSLGANHTMWVPIIYVVGPLCILILSFKHGKKGWTWFDVACLFLVSASLFSWWAFGSPMAALLINLFVDFLGALPTVRKVYYEPETEDRTAWVLSCIGSMINLFAIEDWTFTISVYPMYVAISIGLVTIFIFVRRRTKS